MPPDIRLEDFVAAGGKAPLGSARPEPITARRLFDQYLAAHANGAIETNSLGTLRTDFPQLAGTWASGSASAACR